MITAPSILFFVGIFLIIIRTIGTISIDDDARTLAVDEASLSIPILSKIRFNISNPDKIADLPIVIGFVLIIFFMKTMLNRAAAIPQVIVRYAYVDRFDGRLFMKT